MLQIEFISTPPKIFLRHAYHPNVFQSAEKIRDFIMIVKFLQSNCIILASCSKIGVYVIRWIVIHSVDRVIHSLNKRGQAYDKMYI